MIRQQAWDIYEAVLLLEIFLRYQSGELTKKEAIQNASKKLRRMAKNRGLAIDDTFRNENGLSFQIKSMESAVVGATTLKPASALFTEIVRIYHDDSAHYQQLLEEANRMASIPTHTSEETFMAWLAERVTPVQLSDYYVVFRDIQEYSKRINGIRGSLFENMSEARAKKIEQLLLSNKGFQMTRRKQMRKISTALQYYRLYAKEVDASYPQSSEGTKLPTDGTVPVIKTRDVPATSSEPKIVPPKTPVFSNQDAQIPLAERVKSALAAECRTNKYGTTADYLSGLFPGFRKKVIQEILRSAPWAKLEFGKWQFVEETLTTSPTAAQDAVKHGQKAEESFIIDLESPPILAYAKPTSLSYFGDETADFQSWAGLLTKLVAILYEDYPHVMKIGMHFSKRASRRIELGDAIMARDMVSPKEFLTADKSRLYVETNASADNIVSKIKFLLDLCQIDYENVVIHYVTSKEKKENTREQQAPPKTVTARTSPTDSDMKQFRDGIQEVLREHYAYGFRYESIREFMRFRQFAEQMKVIIPEDDEQLRIAIMESGTIIDDKVFCLDDDFPKEMQRMLDEIFDAGTAAVYYGCLLDKKAEWFISHSLQTEEVLKEYLKQHVRGYAFSKKFITRGEKHTEKEIVTSEILRVWGDEQTVSVHDLSDRLPYIPVSNIWRVISGNDLFVLAEEGVYLRIDRLIITQQEAQAIIEYVDTTCKEAGFASLSSVPLGDIEEENYDLSQTTILNAIYKRVLIGRFHLNGRILTKDKPELDVVALLKDAIDGRDECTFDEIAERVVALTGSSHRRFAFQVLYDEMVRVDENRFVATRFVKFNVGEIDRLLSEFITDGFGAIKNVTTFAMFPICGYPWNHFLLESYCYRYSKDYNLRVLHFNDKNAGIISESNSDKSYGEMLAIELARSGIELSIENAGKYLFENGYMAKRKYSKLGEIVQRAIELREEG